MNAPVSHAVSLAESREFCQRLTRAHARNFYYGLKLLPPAKRESMFALYAWMRRADDIADEEDGRSLQERLDALEGFAAVTRAVLASGTGAGDAQPLWPAFYDMASRAEVPGYIFDEVIAGQRQDLGPVAFDTLDQLHTYCYRVAGVVGLASIYIWGFEGGKETEELAIKRGEAFQLTNILRDLREDLARGRIYLPREEVAGVFPLSDGSIDGHRAFIEMMRFQTARAERCYQESAPLDERVAADCRPTLSAMTEIYRRLLQKIARHPLSVLGGRVSLSAWTKLRIAWRAMRAARRAQ